MNIRSAAVAGLAVGLLLLTVAWVFELELARVLLLAPVIVVVTGAIAGLLVLWWRMLADSLRRRS